MHHGLLGVQFATTNRETLGLPEHIGRYLTPLHRVLPLVLVAFIAWEGAWFEFNVQASSSRTLFGTEITSSIKAGLDYGYWVALCGVLVLVFAVSASIKRVGQLMATTAAIAFIAIGVAFGYTHATKHSSTSASSSPSLIPAISERHDDLSKPALNFDSSPFVQTVEVKARALEKNIEASRYSPEIIITPTFRNVSNKEIVGIRGRIAVLDAFGKEVYSFGFRDDDKHPAGSTSKVSGGYVFEDNQFEDDDPFSKMYPLVSADNAKYSVQITELAFSDGTVLPSSNVGK